MESGPRLACGVPLPALPCRHMDFYRNPWAAALSPGMGHVGGPLPWNGPCGGLTWNGPCGGPDILEWAMRGARGSSAGQ
jgi:hypothetical protein